MEFGGVMGVGGLVGSSCEGGGGEGNVGGGSNSMLFSSALVSSDTTDSTRPKGLFGSAASLKQGRTGVTEEQQDWRCLKMARTEAMLMPTEKGHSSSFLRSNTHSLFPEGQQMLSFSSPKQDSLVVCHDGNLPYYHPSTSSMSSASAAYARNAGLGCGGLNMNMHGVLSGIRGPFTPSQWVELEHQAMIYKYIDANAPIPPSLLISIRKSQNLSRYTGYSAGSLTPSTIGWGSFQLGYSGSSDPEPGRCRRTDGKKWRCSRDAVADQKYCERHMNRGRHRSRKPVEGHPGHAKAMPIIAPSSAASAASVGGSPNDLTIAHQQVKSLQPSSTDPSPTQFNRILMNKENANNQVHDAHSLSMSISKISTTKDTVPVPPISKQYNPFEHSSRQADFGLSSSNYFLNRSISSYMENRNTTSTPELSNQESQPQLLRHFIDNWPKNQSDRSTMAWPELEQCHSDRTQLSISIPMASSDFSSSSAQEKITLSPLKSSRELDPIHMGLGVGGILDNISQRQGSWAPISWGTSMGGPLGEVLNNTNNNPKDCIKNNSPALNLMDHWDSSPRLDSSPTGVLQKTAFGSHSSSTGSSPRAEKYKNKETTGNLCDDLLGSTLVNATSM